MHAAGTSEGVVPIGIKLRLSDDRRREAAAIERREQVGGPFFDLVPFASRVGSKQLVPASLGVHRSPFVNKRVTWIAWNVSDPAGAATLISAPAQCLTCQRGCPAKPSRPGPQWA